MRTAVRRSHAYRLARQVATRIAAHDIPGLSAELAYRGLLAVFPFFIFVGTVSAYVAIAFHVDNPAARIINHTGDALPRDVANVFQRQLATLLERRQPGLLSFGFIGAVVVATAAMNTMIKALNRVYGTTETRPFWRKTLTALALTALAGAAIVAAFALVVVGHIFGGQFADQIGLGGAYGPAVNLARWPLVLFLVLAAATIVYRYAPARSLKLPWTSAGALFFTISWSVMTYLFGLYIAHSRSYQATYGALAGIVILMLWFYLSAFIFLIGGEINRLLGAGLDLPEEPQC